MDLIRFVLENEPQAEDRLWFMKIWGVTWVTPQILQVPGSSARDLYDMIKSLYGVKAVKRTKKRS